MMLIINSITIRIDISKQKFDVCLIDLQNQKQQKTFTNDNKGFEAFKAIIPSNSEVVAAIEATGCYGENLVHYLYSCDIKVFVLNPAQVKYYAKSVMLRTKTDKVDAKLICDFLKIHQDQLHQWKPRPISLEELQGLYRCICDFKDDRARVKCHIESCTNTDSLGKKIALPYYESQLKHLTEKIKELRSLAIEKISSSEELSKKFELLKTIPGIGEETALGILAELIDVNRFVNAKQLAAYAGLNPAIRESGSSVKGRGKISKVGSKQLRSLLYLPAMSALRYNPIIKAFGDRLKAKGKNGKVIIVAAMRKLLHMIYGILKSGNLFNTGGMA
jgi:transposase